MNIETGLAIAGGAIISKDLVVKVLGPTSEYLGSELRNLVEKCNVNLSEVFAASIRKGADARLGSVHPRVAKAIIEDAGFADDEVLKEYYAGMLCSSKSLDEDDSAVSYITLMKGMSRTQVRSHFLIYGVTYLQLPPDMGAITFEENRANVRIILSINHLFDFLGKIRDDQWEGTLNHVVSGLLRNELIGPFFQYGPAELLNAKCPELGGKVTEDSLIVTMSIAGAEFFLWAAGAQNPNPNWILRKDPDLLAQFPKRMSEILRKTIPQ